VRNLRFYPPGATFLAPGFMKNAAREVGVLTAFYFNGLCLFPLKWMHAPQAFRQLPDLQESREEHQSRLSFLQRALPHY
jgi:hypothetical protein